LILVTPAVIAIKRFFLSFVAGGPYNALFGWFHALVAERSLSPFGCVPAQQKVSTS